MNLNILRAYAQKNPSTIPPSVLFSHSADSLTIYDAYPKAAFHFLILPKIHSDDKIPVSALASLRTLLKYDKEGARKVLEGLNEDANSLKKEIEEEMVRLHGYKYAIHCGFHAVPSMTHLHLHVISSDLCSPCLKNKKHYNSFHPTLGFFLHLSDVLSWFDADSGYYDTMSDLKDGQYEPLLKRDLVSHRTDAPMKNMPTLKAHLQAEWDRERKAERARLERKRKREGGKEPVAGEVSHESKRHESGAKSA